MSISLVNSISLCSFRCIQVGCDYTSCGINSQLQWVVWTCGYAVVINRFMDSACRFNFNCLRSKGSLHQWYTFILNKKKSFNILLQPYWDVYLPSCFFIVSLHGTMWFLHVTVYYFSTASECDVGILTVRSVVTIPVHYVECSRPWAHLSSVMP